MKQQYAIAGILVALVVGLFAGSTFIGSKTAVDQSNLPAAVGNSMKSDATIKDTKAPGTLTGAQAARNTFCSSRDTERLVTDDKGVKYILCVHGDGANLYYAEGHGKIW